MAKDTSLVSLLDRHIRTLSLSIGERHCKKPDALKRAASYIEAELKATGLAVSVLEYEFRGQSFANIEAVLAGSEPDGGDIVIGAHYDSEFDTPGANDNGTGVAAVLAIANDLKDYRPKSSLRFVAFANEEAQFFNTDGMGSMVYARALKAQGRHINLMFSLETMGYFTAGAGSQRYPEELQDLGLPDQGNFLAFVSREDCLPQLEKTVSAFRLFSNVPCEMLAADENIQGVSLSDHMSFWKQGYPAIMVTDTAPYRYPHYHQPQDTPDKINMKVYKEAVLGLTATIAHLAGKS